MRNELSRLDAVAQAELVARGELTALELVDAAIARVERTDPPLNAIACRDFERARERARRGVAGALAGVPFVAKDLLPVPGVRCSFGSRLFREHVPTDRSPYTDALEDAGLVLLGKATTSEFGLLGSTESLAHGLTRNPWDGRRSALGSSGGSAVAVASGMVPLAHASDGGGSIRIPASGCGLFGFKPGRDRLLPLAVPPPMGLVIEHAVTRSVRDSALLHALTEAPGAGPRVGYVRGPDRRRLRIGVYSRTIPGREPEPEVAAALEATVALCRGLGHEVVETAAPALDARALSDAFFTFAGAGMAQMAGGMAQMLGRPLGEGDLEPFTSALIAWFLGMPAGALERAFAAMAEGSQAMLAFAGRFDVLLCPTLPCLPLELGTLAPTLDRATLIERTEWLAGYTPIHNMAGMPAMSVPLAVSAGGLPIGSHFAAAPGAEATLFGLAYELEQAAPWADRYPVVEG